MTRRGGLGRRSGLWPLLVATLALGGCRSDADTWDDELLKRAGQEGLAVMERRAPRKWSDPATLVHDRNMAVAILHRDSTQANPGRIYDTKVLWAAPLFFANGKHIVQSYGGWERVDCGVGRLGSFLRVSIDSVLSPDAVPDAWWPMRSAEAAFFCPGSAPSVKDIRLTEASPYERTLDSEATASFDTWFAARRSAIDSALGTVGAKLEGLPRRDEPIRCMTPIRSTRVEQVAGEASVSCHLWIKTAGESVPTFLSVEFVRLARDQTWRPLTELGYLDRDDDGEDGTERVQDELPAALQPRLVEALGEPIERSAWREMSIDSRAGKRAGSAGW